MPDLVQSLPPEIVCRIFLQCLPPPIDPLSPRFETSVSSPLCLSHVCQTWRSFTLSHGELWSYLCICVDARQKRRNGGILVEIFDAWLSRTNGCPLHFTVECSLLEGAGAEDHERAEYFITTMLSQQHRWKDVNFIWSGVKFSPNFAGLEINNIPILKSLTLHVRLPSQTSIDISRSPLLSSLYLSGNFNLSPIAKPLLLLTEGNFRLRSDDGFTWSRIIGTCLDFLNHTPCLETFKGEFIHERTTANRRASDHRLTPPLRALKLEHGDASAAILDSLSLPSLEALYYANDVGDGVLSNFFQRSMPPLTLLSVHGSCASEVEMIGILRLLPCLKDLRYSKAHVSERFFRELSVESRQLEKGSGPHIICPALEIVDFHDLKPLSDVSQCAEALKDMLKSRATIQQSFEKIWVNLSIWRVTVVDVQDIDGYTTALELCFEGGEGDVLVGDFTYVMSNPFPLGSVDNISR